MAVLRAAMVQVETLEPVDSSTFAYGVRWICISLGRPNSFDIQTVSNIATSDTAAQATAKIIDSIVAAATSRGDTLARTNVYLLDIIRGT